MPKPGSIQSQKAGFYYHFIHALYYWMTFDHQQAIIHSQQLLQTSSESLPPGDYINGLLEHITSCVCTGKFQDALKGMEMGNAFIEEANLTQSHAFTGRMFAYRATYEMIIYNYMGNRSKLTETIRYVEQQLQHYDKLLTFESRQVIVTNLMNAYMGMGDMKKADEIWDSLFNKQSKTIRQDIYGDLFLFRLFSLLENKTFVLVSSAAQSAIRYYRKPENENPNFKLELAVANVLSRKADFENGAIKREMLIEIKSILQKFIKGLKGCDDFQEHYTRYTIWCDSLINSESYHLTASRWYKNFNIQN